MVFVANHSFLESVFEATFRFSDFHRYFSLISQLRPKKWRGLVLRPLQGMVTLDSSYEKLVLRKTHFWNMLNLNEFDVYN